MMSDFSRARAGRQSAWLQFRLAVPVLYKLCNRHTAFASQVLAMKFDAFDLV
jgi:hypothetical protein